MFIYVFLCIQIIIFDDKWMIKAGLAKNQTYKTGPVDLCFDTDTVFSKLYILIWYIWYMI